MQSGTSRDNILKQLRGEWVPDVQQLVKSEIAQEFETFDQHLEQALKVVDEDEIEKAFKTLADKFKAAHQEEDKKGEDKTEADLNSDWARTIRELTAGIENEVHLKQENERFQWNKEDYFGIKAGKLLKKTALGIHTGFYKLGQIFRKTREEKIPDSPIWNQTIPLKNIVELYLLDIGKLLDDWRNETERLRAEILLEADAWILHSTELIHFEEKDSGEDDEKAKSEGADLKIKKDHPVKSHVPNRRDIRVFFEEAQKELNQLRSRFLDEVEKELQQVEQEITVALSVTGTFERSVNNYTTAVISQKENTISAKERRNRDSWNELLNALVNRMNLTQSFQQLYHQAGERIAGFTTSLNDFFSETIENPRQELESMLKEAITVFDDAENKSLKDVRELSSGHREKMKKHVDEKLLKPLQEYVNEATLSTKFDRFTSAIPEWTKNQQEKATLVEQLDLSQFPPKYEFESVDWQILVQRVINNHLAKEFLPKELKPEEFLMQLVQGFREVSQIIFTNLEIADEVKKTDEEEPFEVAKEGLQRASTKLADLETLISSKKEEWVFKLGGKRKEAFTKLAMLLEKQDVNEVRITGAGYKAKETAVDWKTKLQVIWAKISEKTELFSRFIWRKVKYYFSVVQKFLGFAKKEHFEEDKTDLATFLSETDEKIAGLPFIYRRLFDFKKEVEERFYVRRTDQFERFKKGYELWQNNFPSTFSIVGERGSGKSIFIKLMKEEVLKKQEVIEINFQQTVWEPAAVVQKISEALKISEVSDTEALIEAIGRKRKRVVIILENIQKCYLRKISGFEALEQLMYLISETNKNILWITSSTRYGWLFLDKTLSISDYFTHTVQTDTLSNDQIRDLILKRHQASGYQLRFLPDEAVKKSRNYKKLLDDEEKTQEYLQNRYFEKLGNLAEGNSSIAMIYWIRSIQDYDETYFNIKPFDFGAINRIEELDSEELFALAAFILHDSLTAPELSYIMHEPLRDSKVMISRLVSRSIITPAEYGYSLNHLIYRQLIRVLKEANYIH